MGLITDILPYIQIALSALLIVLVLVQFSDADLGGSFGGSDGMSATRTRRGIEKTIFRATIVVTVLFTASTLVALIVR